MKKVISLLLAFVLIMGTLPVMAKVEREVWVPSPGITCGITSDEVLFNKAVHSCCARLYKLDAIGDRYYTASSSLSISELKAFAINDTKIILALATVSNSWFNEYYRASVVTENDDGIVEVPQPLGKKNLVIPEDTDTEPISEIVDFAADDLELGFNIKTNIIGTDKFTPEVREMVETIHLNDLVIVAKEGGQQGE